MKNNSKVIITRDVIVSTNSIGEPIFSGTSTTIVTNKNCYVEKNDNGSRQQRDTGISGSGDYSMFIGANVDVQRGDNALIDTVNYTVVDIMPLGRRFLEVSLERNQSV